MIHLHLAERMKLDYEPFIEESDVLIERLSEQIRQLVKKRLSEIGHPDAKKW
jgi:hypothetical protein